MSLDATPNSAAIAFEDGEEGGGAKLDVEEAVTDWDLAFWFWLPARFGVAAEFRLCGVGFANLTGTPAHAEKGSGSRS